MNDNIINNADKQVENSETSNVDLTKSPIFDVPQSKTLEENLEPTSMADNPTIEQDLSIPIAPVIEEPTSSSELDSYVSPFDAESVPSPEKTNEVSKVEDQVSVENTSTELGTFYTDPLEEENKRIKESIDSLSASNKELRALLEQRKKLVEERKVIIPRLKELEAERNELLALQQQLDDEVKALNGSPFAVDNKEDQTMHFESPFDGSLGFGGR
mgnify:CR=1 FL=1